LLELLLSRVSPRRQIFSFSFFISILYHKMTKNIYVCTIRLFYDLLLAVSACHLQRLPHYIATLLEEAAEKTCDNVDTIADLLEAIDAYATEFAGRLARNTEDIAGSGETHRLTAVSTATLLACAATELSDGSLRGQCRIKGRNRLRIDTCRTIYYRRRSRLRILLGLRLATQKRREKTGGTLSLVHFFLLEGSRNSGVAICVARRAGANIRGVLLGGTKKTSEEAL